MQHIYVTNSSYAILWHLTPFCIRAYFSMQF